MQVRVRVDVRRRGREAGSRVSSSVCPPAVRGHDRRAPVGSRTVPSAALANGSSNSSSSNEGARPLPAVSLASFSSTSSSLKHIAEGRAEAPQQATVRFWLKFKTTWGQGVKLIGSHPKLGSWTLSQALELRWAEGDLWTAAVALPAGGVYEYKYVVFDYNTKQALMWQSGGNAVLAVDASELEVEVHDNWGNDPGAEVHADGDAMTRENKLQKWASNLIAQYRSTKNQNEQLAQWAHEGQAMKGEVARLKMELGLMHHAQRERDEQVAALKQQNARLQQELMHSRQELQASFAEALLLLDDEEHLAPSSAPAAPDAATLKDDGSGTKVGGAHGGASPAVGSADVSSQQRRVGGNGNGYAGHVSNGSSSNGSSSNGSSSNGSSGNGSSNRSAVSS